MKKECCQCHKDKEETKFYKRSNGNPNSICKECFNKYCVERWTQRKIKAIIFKGSCCKDCGISYPKFPPNVFDFHHRDPKTKEFNWTKLRLKTANSIIEELEKCDLLCANCHRIRHFEINSTE